VKYFTGLLAACAGTSAVIVGLAVGTPSNVPAAPVPSVFCPAGQHVTGIAAGSPECAGPARVPQVAKGMLP
jgi:hypothetical protein